jgi:hypothetical protein
MVDTIFDMDDTHVVQQNITYQYQPSPHLQSIRHVIAKRCHGKRKRLSDAKEEEQNDSQSSLQKKSKTTKNKLSKPEDFCRDSGLPSPPVEMVSTEFLPGTPPPSSPKVVNATDQIQKKQLRHAISGLTATEILTKLDDLKAEKHRLFQIMKRLVQEEAVRERGGTQAPSASNSVDGDSRDEEKWQQPEGQQQYQQLPQRSLQSSHLSTPPEEHQKYSTSCSPTPPTSRPPASTSSSAAAMLHVSNSSSSSSSSPSFSYFRSYDRHHPHHSHHHSLSSPSTASTSSRPYPSSAWSNLPRHPLPQS